ncbi:hypothetical protein PRK78_004008 [Emydomyces testavorans]|uniref:Uncharacterized protein n=1 Tax=Emydomyces testavorans TaxID=2070801 RepID=A0AAF0II77_9EURO|nr:hypothetical protein PRK78_004008 [Emydomyces testavorans]
MSEPAYLCLTPMYKAMYPPYVGESSIISITRYRCPSIIPSWPPSRQSSIHEVTHDLADLDMSDQDSFPSWKSSISVDSPIPGGSGDESDPMLLRYILHRVPESEPTRRPTLNLRNTERHLPSYSADEWAQSDFELFDIQSDSDADWHRYSLLLFEAQQWDRASHVDSLANNYDSDESATSSLATSCSTWSGSQSVLTSYVGGKFLELTPQPPGRL